MVNNATRRPVNVTAANERDANAGPIVGGVEVFIVSGLERSKARQFPVPARSARAEPDTGSSDIVGVSHPTHARGLQEALASTFARPMERVKAPLTAEPIEAPVPVTTTARPSVVGTLVRRSLKTAVALAIAATLGFLPLRSLLQVASTEAIVNGQLFTVRAPIEGTVAPADHDVFAWSRVEKSVPLLRIFGSGDVASVSAPVSGRVWEIATAPGERVERGQDLLRVLDCSTAMVTASVTEGIFNQLAIGTPARFRFRGDTADHDGTVASLFGAASPPGNFAIDLVALTKEPYRVMLAVPDLGSDGGCAIGKTGRVIFDPPNTPTGN